MKIPFNIPYLTGKEEKNIKQALKSRGHCGNHDFSNSCISLMKEKYGFGEVFLTPSCSAAMEMGTMLAGIGPGDEVILPSYTFSSTANAVIMHGGIPIFCDVDPQTMNIDVKKITKLITKKTKMIIPIDYAGVPCEIDKIMNIAKKHKLIVMVDAAQSYHSYYKGKPCGSWGDMSAFSFHETKNTTCGEGGALVVNRPEWVQRAHFLQEKGTDRQLVLDGVKTKYHWVSKGSSYLLSDILAAMLLTQLESVKSIVSQRGNITKAYRKILTPYEKRGFIKLPLHSSDVKVNNHAFFIIFNTMGDRAKFISKLKEKNISAYIGYEPLHSSPMGQSLGYKPDDLPITEDLASRLVRLPFYTELQGKTLDYCIKSIDQTLKWLLLEK